MRCFCNSSLSYFRKEKLMALYTREEALEYHRSPRRGKLEVIPIKPCETQKDLTLA